MRGLRIRGRDFLTLGLLSYVVTSFFVAERVGSIIALPTLVATFFLVLLSRQWYYDNVHKRGGELEDQDHCNQIDP